MGYQSIVVRWRALWGFCEEGGGWAAAGVAVIAQGDGRATARQLRRSRLQLQPCRGVFPSDEKAVVGASCSRSGRDFDFTPRLAASQDCRRRCRWLEW